MRARPLSGHRAVDGRGEAPGAGQATELIELGSVQGERDLFLSHNPIVVPSHHLNTTVGRSNKPSGTKPTMAQSRVVQDRSAILAPRCRVRQRV